MLAAKSGNDEPSLWGHLLPDAQTASTPNEPMPWEHQFPAQAHAVSRTTTGITAETPCRPEVTPARRTSSLLNLNKPETACNYEMGQKTSGSAEVDDCAALETVYFPGTENSELEESERPAAPSSDGERRRHVTRMPRDKMLSVHPPKRLKVEVDIHAKRDENDAVSRISQKRAASSNAQTAGRPSKRPNRDTVEKEAATSENKPPHEERSPLLPPKRHKGVLS